MEQQDRERYVSPEITRVVLRSEQAVLSACSTAGNLDTGGVQCAMLCRKAFAQANSSGSS